MIRGKIFIIFEIAILFLFSANFVYSDPLIIDPVHGPAMIQNDSGNYYYIKLKIKVDENTTLKFGDDSCIITGINNEIFEDCWIHIAAWEGAMSVSQEAPIMMNTLIVNTQSNNESIHQWNATMIAGPKGALALNLEKSGSVDLYFLWKVNSDFVPKNIKIKKLIEIVIN
jgi:hypothetical protein